MKYTFKTFKFSSQLNGKYWQKYEQQIDAKMRTITTLQDLIKGIKTNNLELKFNKKEGSS